MEKFSDGLRRFGQGSQTVRAYVSFVVMTDDDRMDPAVHPLDHTDGMEFYE